MKNALTKNGLTKTAYSGPHPPFRGLMLCAMGLLTLTGAAGSVPPEPATPAAATAGSVSRTAPASPWSGPWFWQSSSPRSLPSSTQWSWPVDPPRSVLRGFEAPATEYSAGHRGVDVRAPPGAAVYAPAAGVVSFAGRVVDRPVLSIAHSGDLVSSLEPVEAVVAEGQQIAAGERIGTVAAGGHCSGRCLHFGMRLRGRYISPMLYFGGVPRAVLLPVP